MPRTPCAVVDFLQKLSSDHTWCPGGECAMTQLLARARITAIGAVASAAVPAGQDTEARPLNLQHAFVLHVFAADSPIFNHVNQALITGSGMQFWAPFIATLRDAVH